MPKIAACHIAPVYLDPGKTTNKIVSYITEAASNQADLVAFPESYLPGFPIWLSLSSPIRNHQLFIEFAEASVYVDGPEITKIRACAKLNKIYVSLGISEKTHTSTATLYNANLIIAPSGEIVVHHRKLCPTFYEKLVWASGDGYGLRVIDCGAQIGRLGALICGENTNALARYAMISQGEQIHVACFPPIWPTRPVPSSEQVEMSGPGKNYDNVAANRTRAAAHSFEAKAFTVVVSAYFSADCKAWIKSKLESALYRDAATETYVTELETAMNSQQSATLVTDPSGSQCTPTIQHEEAILYADLDLAETVEGKQYHDVSGGYQRTDVFGFTVDRTRRQCATFID